MLTEQKNIAGETIASQTLLEVFRKFSGRKVAFIEPGGNHGDYLIYKGAYKLAKLAGIEIERLTVAGFMEKTFSDDDVVYIHGSGGFVPMWSGTPIKVLNKLSQEFKGVVILGPSTFSDDFEYIRTVFDKAFGNNRFKQLFVFSRERVSDRILRANLPCRAEILCDHDTALNLVKSDLVSTERRPRYVLYAIRNDKERLASQQYDYLSWVDVAHSCSSFDKWVECHQLSKKIVTNRTHSTILGSVLEIPTVMMPNSYHKNRSIWEYSLQQRGVEWVDHMSCSSLNKVIEDHAALKKMFTSRLYKSLFKVKMNLHV